MAHSSITAQPLPVSADAPIYGASPRTAFLRGWQRYAVFAGRASRSEYWWWTLIAVIVSTALEVVHFALAGDMSAYWSDSAGLSAGGLPSNLWSLAILIPSLAVGSRRLHDTNRSGWWLLIGLVPLVGWVILIVLLAAPTEHTGRRSAAVASR